MSTDTRERILRAAASLAEENVSVQGVAISLESVANRAGLTKPGLMYHFGSKQALMLGVVEYSAQHWDQLLRAAAGAGPEELSTFDRYRTYVGTAMTTGVTRGEYRIFSEAIYLPALADAWRRNLAPWFATDGLAPGVVALLTAARFTADGAWIAEATGVFPAGDPAAVRGHALELVDRAEELS